MEDRIEEVATTILHDRHCHLGEGPVYEIPPRSTTIAARPAASMAPWSMPRD